jgi:hypothetical protein
LSQQARAKQALPVDCVPDLRVLISWTVHRLAQQDFGLGEFPLQQSQARQCRQSTSSCKFAGLESLAIQRLGPRAAFVPQDRSCLLSTVAFRGRDPAGGGRSSDSWALTFFCAYKQPPCRKYGSLFKVNSAQ